MTTPKHTPGPWKHDSVWNLIMHGKTEIAAIHSGNVADARLIASAPALVEALQIIEENLPPDRHLLPEALETIRLCRRAAMSALRSAGIDQDQA